MQKGSQLSTIVLLLILAVLIGLVRIYYGGSAGIMVVWKSEFGLRDTLVNVAQMEQLPRPDLERDHKEVLLQMEEMGLLESQSDFGNIKRRPVKIIRDSKTGQPEAVPLLPSVRTD